MELQLERFLFFFLHRLILKNKDFLAGHGGASQKQNKTNIKIYFIK
jgi:hypothetical protein